MSHSHYRGYCILLYLCLNKVLVFRLQSRFISGIVDLKQSGSCANEYLHHHLLTLVRSGSFKLVFPSLESMNLISAMDFTSWHCLGCYSSVALHPFVLLSET